MIEMFGWLGGMLLAFCGLPEAIKTVWNRRCDVSFSFLIMWLFGEVLSLVYVAFKNEQVDLLPLLLNYGINIVFILVMLYFKWRPGNGKT